MTSKHQTDANQSYQKTIGELFFNQMKQHTLNQSYTPERLLFQNTMEVIA